MSFVFRERILIAEYDKETLENLLPLLHSYDTKISRTIKESLSCIRKKHFDLVISKLRFEEGSGAEFLKEARRIRPSLPFIFTSSEFSYEEMIEVMKQNNIYFLPKLVYPVIVSELVTRSLSQRTKKISKHGREDYSMESFYRAIIKGSETEILKLLDTVDNLIELIYPCGIGPFPEIKTALYELLSNANEHGNPLRKGNIYFSIELKMDRIILRVRDEGAGFNYREYMRKEALETYRGLSLVVHLMDGISFNHTGNEVNLLKLI